jgi:hypothetical protein
MSGLPREALRRQPGTEVAIACDAGDVSDVMPKTAQALAEFKRDNLLARYNFRPAYD